jgi:Beta-ketoacyl synthase, N-terminal domain
MAPYVLTPISEREHTLGGREYHSIEGSSSGGEATPTSSASGTDLFTNDTLTNATVGTGNHVDSQEVAANDLDPSSAPESFKYEDAYTHGYKDGYTASHIELKHQPIAIIGMSCRLPGSVSTPDDFWELLARSRTGFSDIPSSRFSEKRFFHPNPGKSGTTNARGGNFLTQDLTAFDAPFFGFTQQEAISLDPQQRLLLECTFESLESAGIPKHEVVGKDVGVFVGGTFSE